METLFLLNIVLLSVTFYFIVSFISNIKQSRKAADEIRTTQTVSMFATARNNLILLVNDGKLDAKSNSFKTLYGLNTAFMRRPEQYLQISKDLLSTFGSSNSKKNNGKSLILIDVDKNNDNYESVLNVYAETMNAVSHIAIEYSLPLRVLMKFTKGEEDELKHLNFLYNSINGLDFLKKITKEYEEKKKFEKYQAELKSDLNSNFKLA